MPSNFKKRQNEMIKITLENQSILKRLQDKQSTYSVSKWKQESVERKKLLRNICEYPYQLDYKRHKSVSPSRRSNMRVRRTSRANETTPFRMRKHKNMNISSILPDLKKVTLRKPSRLRVLCSKRAELRDNTFYNIQIQRNKKNKHLYLIAQNESKEVRNDDYYIDLPNKEAKCIEKIFKKDYRSVLDSISIQNNKLVLLNPNYVEPKTRNFEPLEETKTDSEIVNNTIG
jgi:hypothetical protein